MVNLQALAAKLQTTGIMDKAFADMSRDDVLVMVGAVVEALETRRMPYFESYGDYRELVIPRDAPVEMQPHRAPCGWLAMHRTLCTLGATEEEFTRYLGPTWHESLAVHLAETPTCPTCGHSIERSAS